MCARVRARVYVTRDQVLVLHNACAIYDMINNQTAVFSLLKPLDITFQMKKIFKTIQIHNEHALKV